MKKVSAIALILGFLTVDFLFFHDAFKAGERVTFPQYLTGVLSLPVIVICGVGFGVALIWIVNWLRRRADEEASREAWPYRWE